MGRMTKQARQANQYNVLRQLGQYENDDDEQKDDRTNRPDKYDKAEKYGMYGKISKTAQAQAVQARTEHVKTNPVESSQTWQTVKYKHRLIPTTMHLKDVRPADEYEYDNPLGDNPLGDNPLGDSHQSDRSENSFNSRRHIPDEIVFVNYDGQEVSPAEYRENEIEPDDFDAGYSSD